MMPESCSFGRSRRTAASRSKLTHNPFDIESAFSWSPDGKSIAYVADNSIFTSDAESGAAREADAEVR